MPGDVIILHKSTKNYDHMVYCSWYMARDECNFVNFHFGLFFALKNENFKKNEKNPWDIIILHKCSKNQDHMYTVPEVWHATDVIVIFHFGLFFAFLPP